MSKKVLTGAMAAVMATGMVPVTAMAQTTDLGALYSETFKAVMAAKEEGTQVAINAARALLAEYKAEIIAQEKEGLLNQVNTLSVILDGVQQPLYSQIVKAINKMKEAGTATQAEINDVRTLIEGDQAVEGDEILVESFIKTWNAEVDPFQAKLIDAAEAAVKVAETEKTQVAVDAANKLLADLATAVRPGVQKIAADKQTRLDAVVTAAVVESVSAIGAKKLEVKFNKAVDTAAAKITVKKGLVSTNVEKITFAEDKMSAVIETTTKLTKGDYKVTVAGLTDEALVSAVTVEDEKVNKINVTSETAPMTSTTNAVVRFEVLNQYNEDVTSTYGSAIQWTASTGGLVTTAGTGKINVPSATAYIPGSKVYVTGVYTNATTGNSAVVNAGVTIALESKADKVVFERLYNGDGKVFNASFVNGQFVALFDVYDQYGNVIDASVASNLVTVQNSLVFTSNNPLFIATPASTDVTTATVDGKVRFALPIKTGSQSSKGGTAVIQAVSNATGSISRFEISTEAQAVVKSFQMEAPAVLVTQDKEVEIPFVALDQYGNQITKHADLVGKITFAARTGDVFELQPITEGDKKGQAKLVYKPGVANPTGAVYLTSVVTDGGNFSSLMLDVKAKSVATSIVGVDAEVAKTIAKGATVKLKAQDLIIQDQHGNIMSDDEVNAWLGAAADDNKINIAQDNANVTLGSIVFNSAADEITLTGATKGSTILTFTLENSTGTIASSAKTQEFKVVETSVFKSYKVKDLATLYVNPAAATSALTHSVTTQVYGVMENGTEVLLPTSRYEVVVDETKLDVTDGVITETNLVEADFVVDGKSVDTIKKSVSINVKETNGAFIETLKTDLTLSKVAPKGAELELVEAAKDKDIQVAHTTNAINVSDLIAGTISKVKDQYGVAFTNKADALTSVVIKNVTEASTADGNPSFTVTNNGTITTAISGTEAGDKFNVVLTFGNASVEVAVEVE